MSVHAECCAERHERYEKSEELLRGSFRHVHKFLKLALELVHDTSGDKSNYEEKDRFLRRNFNPFHDESRKGTNNERNAENSDTNEQGGIS